MKDNIKRIFKFLGYLLMFNILITITLLGGTTIYLDIIDLSPVDFYMKYVTYPNLCLFLITAIIYFFIESNNPPSYEK